MATLMSLAREREEGGISSPERRRERLAMKTNERWRR
jgi:hypothetical protein